MVKQIKVFDEDWKELHLLKMERRDRSVAETFHFFFKKIKELEAAQGVKPDNA